MKQQNSSTIIDRARKLFLWIDESFVCSLFKADLNLGWFCAYARRALEMETEDFEKTVDSLNGDPILKREMKLGYQAFLSFLQESINSIPKNYKHLSIEDKLDLNATIADGIIESSSLLLKAYTERKIENEVEQIKAMYPNWVQIHGVWVNRDKNAEQGAPADADKSRR